MLTNKIPYENIHEFAIINMVGVQGERPELPDSPTAAAREVGWGWDEHLRNVRGLDEGDSDRNGGNSGGSGKGRDGGGVRS